MGSVAGPVIQANGRLTFEDDLRSGGLLNASVGTELADSMVTLGEPRGDLVCEMATLPAAYILQRKVPSASSSGSLFHCVCAVL